MRSTLPYRTLLARVGLTRFAAIVLLVYFTFLLGFQQSLPDNEHLIHAPWSFGVVTVSWILVCCGFLIKRELFRQSRWYDFFNIVGASLILFTLLTSFGYVKSLIPDLVPYYLDPWLHRIELWLHFGRTPYQWVEPHLSPEAFALIDTIYLIGWANGILFYFGWMLFSPRVGEARTVYLSAFATTWIIAGNLLATLLSSVGPIFYDMFYQDAYSATNYALVAKLYAPSSPFLLEHASTMRNLMLEMANKPHFASLNGISAMPSLHNAMALVMVFHSITYYPRLSWFTIPFALAIFIGSFMLGWHYAIDAYASLLIVALVWWLNRRSYRAYGPPPPAAG